MPIIDPFKPEEPLEPGTNNTNLNQNEINVLLSRSISPDMECLQN